MATTAAAPVPDAVAPPPGNRRFPLLDGMRAIAVLAVVVVHVNEFARAGSAPVPAVLAHLNIGVTVFFLISGFVLYRPFIAHRASGPPAPRLDQYAKRRFLRIFPAYWLVLSVLVLVPGLTGVTGGDWLSQYALFHAFSGAGGCVQESLTCGLSQTWSLVVELTFYATLPLYVLVADRLAYGSGSGNWLRRELALLAMLGAGSIVLHFVLDDLGQTILVGGSLLGFMLWFALGMALAAISISVEGTGRRPALLRVVSDHPLTCWSGAIGLYALLCVALPATSFLFDRSDELMAHLGFAVIALLLILPAVFGDTGGGLPRRLLANRAVAWIGLISYGIFLWHYVVALELGSPGSGLAFWPLLAVTLALTISCAAISYYALERPILRLKNTRRDRGSRSHGEPTGSAVGGTP